MRLITIFIAGLMTALTAFGQVNVVVKNSRLVMTSGGGSAVTKGIPWTPARIATLAWYDAADSSTVYGNFIAPELGVLDLSANGGINPATGEAWQAGDQYRLAFVTSNRITSASSDVSVYNAFVQSAADNSSITTLSNATWKAIVSTASVDARDNTGTPLTETGVATFQMDGSEIVFTNNAHMWVTSGVPDPNNKIDKTEHGIDRSATDTALFSGFGGTWTGTRNDGTAENAMGNGGNVNFGIFKAEPRYWIDRGNNSSTGTCPIYGISELLTIQPATGTATDWADKSGNGYDFEQVSLSAQPTYLSRTINGLDSLDFNGTSDWMQQSTNSFGATISNAFVFMVVQVDDVASGDGVFDLSVTSSEGDTNLWNTDTKAWADGEFQFEINGAAGGQRLRWDHDKPDGTVFLVGFNGASPSTKEIWGYGNLEASDYVTAVNAVTTSGGVELCRSGSDSSVLDGAVAEVIFMENTDTATRQKIEGYLAWKWGLESQLPVGHPYKDAAPTLTD